MHQTTAGTRYLTEPGVIMIALPQCDLSGVQEFLDGFPQEADFEEYLHDPDEIDDSARLIKFAGQLCYYSFGKKRTWNKDAQTYFDNLKIQGHGSVLEHASYSFLVYGADRAFTHELVRHRSGMAYAQVSQRYVDGVTLRFVERAEYQQDEELHEMFVRRIDTNVQEYNELAEKLMARQAAGSTILQGEKKRDLRKKVNQCARSCLRNETEAPIVVTANARALRHVIEMRAASPADIAIRAVALKMYRCIKQVTPMLFADYSEKDLPDGVAAVTTQYRKV